jgi:L-rhamnose mutarotase
MKTRAFRMQLKPGTVDEYRRRHDQIWPELREALSGAGIRDYSIFLDPQTLALFAVFKFEDERALDSLPSQQVMQRWWESMVPLMSVKSDNRPVEWPLEQVFHLP